MANVSFNKLLIELVKARPGLYDSSLRLKREAKQELWLEIYDETEHLFDVDRLKAKFKILRDMYVKIKRAVANGRKEEAIKWPYFHELKFLDDVLTQKTNDYELPDSMNEHSYSSAVQKVVNKFNSRKTRPVSVHIQDIMDESLDDDDDLNVGSSGDYKRVKLDPSCDNEVFDFTNSSAFHPQASSSTISTANSTFGHFIGLTLEKLPAKVQLQTCVEIINVLNKAFQDS